MKAQTVIGFTLGEARKILNSAGGKIASIRVTSPPKAELADIDDYYRVINAIDKGEEGIELIICKPL
ncbi:hypothetical protein [Acetivibrio mesophilus]|uniref:Uncharacterized protein n=1 Tax=Acetivibrio mesophilus TaxID=2487273 RepID=A0A4Q0I619_9FIRM|nr:hypothetical protein [Acetivibrio mesophilus]ODM25159.1 hypothetical protein A7W90_02370 [Clostridium sp. Bc-iso-3]RXE59823.1 hypothetical protein EFD62_05805 [Acetivibrio mesophilus]HHV29611.1 hypothetical protein [Clostridium sp.]